MEQRGKVDFKIKFDGKLNQVDADTLINSLSNITTIIQEVSNEFDPQKKIELKINAFKTGSFNIDLELVNQVRSVLETALSGSAVTYANHLLNAFVSLFLLKQFLKGEKAKEVKIEGDNANIFINNGSMTVHKSVYNIYGKNTIVNEALNKNFETLNDDPSIDGFEILDDKETPILNVKKEDFSYMSAKNKILDNKDTDREKTEEAHLSIFKIVFDNKRKWEFYYRGIKITAKIHDANFFKRIEEGERFSKGDMLKVNLLIHQTLDPSVNAYLNKSYDVIEVFEHTPRPSQPNIY